MTFRFVRLSAMLAAVLMCPYAGLAQYGVDPGNNIGLRPAAGIAWTDGNGLVSITQKMIH